MSAQPLAGLRIVVTRPAAQAEELARPLRSAGANVVLTPLIRVAPARLDGALRDAIAQVERYDWLVFSSVNGVDTFMSAARALGSAARLSALSVACVGPATAAAARRHGLRVRAMPEEFVGDAIADALQQHGALAGQRVLLARAAGAAAGLPERLRAGGASVADVELYRSVPDDEGVELLRAHHAQSDLDMITFTASSAVRYFCERVAVSTRAVIAVIGPVTAKTARAAGLKVTIEAEPHTVPGLVGSIVQYVRARSSREAQ